MLSLFIITNNKYFFACVPLGICKLSQHNRTSLNQNVRHHSVLTTSKFNLIKNFSGGVQNFIVKLRFRASTRMQ
jgi:hypothetical protein